MKRLGTLEPGRVLCDPGVPSIDESVAYRVALGEGLFPATSSQPEKQIRSLHGITCQDLVSRRCH